MIERIFTAIGRFFSSIFSFFGDKVEDVKISTANTKQQVKSAAKNISHSFSVNNTTNYYKNRIIGEFLRFIAGYLTYNFDKEVSTYSAYLVRHPSKFTMEYFSFMKYKKEDKVVYISYTVINSIISKTGVTYNIGSTEDKVLAVKDFMSKSIYNAISKKKAPLYVCSSTKDTVGDVKFVYDNWIYMTRLIVDLSFVEGHGPTQDLMNIAGFQLVMSYFDSLKDKWFENVYKPSTMKKLYDFVEYYNSLAFNQNKIISFNYDKEYRSVSKAEGKTIIHYGIIIEYADELTKSSLKPIESYSYKFIDTMLKTRDMQLYRNFLVFVIATGSVHCPELTKITEEDDKPVASDEIVNKMNDFVEEDINTEMKKAGFDFKDDNSDAESQVFETTMDGYVDQSFNITFSKLPKPSVNTVELEDSSNTPEKVFRRRQKTKDSAIRFDIKDSDKIVVNEVEHSTIQKPDSYDVIEKLKSEANKEYTTQNDTTSSVKETVPTNITVESIMKKNLIDWTYDECLFALNNLKPDSGIRRFDVIQRLQYLESKMS